MSLFSVFFGYVAAVAAGMTNHEAVNAALSDDNWALEYIDSQAVVEAAHQAARCDWQNAQV
jgi:hypothetical protein